MQLDARKLQVLSAIVEGYIRTGEPAVSYTHLMQTNKQKNKPLVRPKG